MKKILLLVILSIGLIQFANAQVVELIGKGVLNSNNETLLFTDPASIDHVVVEAAAIFWPSALTPTSVKFYETGLNPEEYTVDFNYAEQNYSPLVNSPAGDGDWGYYTATFNDVDAGGITLDQMANLGHIISFTAYIYRVGGNVDMYCMREDDHAFVFLNGSSNPLTYNFNLPSTEGYRDIEIVIPFSDLESNSLRYATVMVMADGQSVTSEFQTNNKGDLLRLESLMLYAVPGNVTDVQVKIYSPTVALDGKEGDSFITGAVLLCSTNLGCTLTQGYWKTHSIYGPASKPNDTWNLVGGPDALFFYSGQSYLEVLNTAPKKGNAYYILAHQYIAAELNFLDGAGIPTDVQTAFEEATALFEDSENTPYNIGKLKGNDPLRHDFTMLAEILEAYNSGPGHCNDGYDEKSARISNNQKVAQFDGFTVYPNPVSNVARIAFKPGFDGNATIDIYNSLGQRIERLFDKNVQRDIPVTVQLNGNQFNEGLYMLLLQNGTSRETKKIIINR